MFSPLTQMLIDNHGYALVDKKSGDDFLKQNEYSVLFFPGDAERLAESDDVAVILPELMKVFGDRLMPAVVERGDAERALQLRYRFNAFPTLVFLRGAAYLGAISRVQDWQDYVREITEILSHPPSDPPRYEFPEGCVTAGMATESPQDTSAGEPQDTSAGEMQ